MNKGGFSWKRLSGISGAKAKISKDIGIPLTKSGRNQKIGNSVSKGCLGTVVVLLIPLILFVLIF